MELCLSFHFFLNDFSAISNLIAYDFSRNVLGSVISNVVELFRISFLIFELDCEAFIGLVFSSRLGNFFAF